MTIPAVPADRAERIAALEFDYAAQPKMSVTACNLCCGSVFVGLTHRDRYGYPARAQACQRCGLVFLNPRLTADGYRHFYSGVYRPLVSAFHNRVIDAQTIQAEQRSYAAERAEFVRPFVAGAGLTSLLDVGGSTGVVAHHFAREFGLSGLIIDPSPLELEEARRLGLDTVQGLVEEHDFGAQSFDLALVCQTVDHLLDVSGVLKRIRALLSANGLLLLDIVDFRAAYLRNWSVEDAIKIDHPFYLTEETITAYFRQSGFEVIQREYAADHLHVSYLCRPAAVKPDALPTATAVDAMLNEIRFVQNASRR